ncbi:hypothetical protein KIM322_12490 [Lactobacillus xylocopicola]|uniref:GtrA-like protein domain-containing protein n=1 Tax=Lactobacillus xylocopicola TaxID=2976676 RepID=A0ABM8BI51_9LACO|nr:hypothetical protein KIM322_12490 [Lactobacillus xylocopicola]
MLGKKSYLASRLTCGLGNSLYGLVFIWWLQVQSKSSTLVGFANAIFMGHLLIVILTKRRAFMQWLLRLL